MHAVARLVLLLVMVNLTSACSGFFFYPMKPLIHTPAEADIPYEDLAFTASDGVKLHGWLLHAAQPRGVVLFLHGNAENISTHIGSVYWLPEQGFDVVLLDYRGYGRSEGEPDFPEVYSDADAAYRWTLSYAEEHNLPVFILGQSLGAAISSYYFSTLPKADMQFKAMALDAVFSGHRDIARDVASRSFITWPFQFIVPWFVPKDYDPKAHIAGVSPIPLLFFHSPDDQVIPYKQGELVFQQAKDPKEWFTTRGPHIATFNFPENRQKLVQFYEANGALSPTSHPQTD
ncbi:MAG TPA: alpha/beta fold hydrolase [Dongiaceae bacterium]|nr:alpha/beta fold hydrolase [Dongiaceae bacterium]